MKTGVLLPNYIYRPREMILAEGAYHRCKDSQLASDVRVLASWQIVGLASRVAVALYVMRRLGCCWNHLTD